MFINNCESLQPQEVLEHMVINVHKKYKVTKCMISYQFTLGRENTSEFMHFQFTIFKSLVGIFKKYKFKLLSRQNIPIWLSVVMSNWAWMKSIRCLSKKFRFNPAHFNSLCSFVKLIWQNERNSNQIWSDIFSKYVSVQLDQNHISRIPANISEINQHLSYIYTIYYIFDTSSRYIFVLHYFTILLCKLEKLQLWCWHIC